MKNPQDMDKQMAAMQESMLKMHEHMNKIMDAKNPQLREQLMQEHRHLMHQYMQTMGDGGMMGGKEQKDSTKLCWDSGFTFEDHHYRQDARQGGSVERQHSSR